MLNVPTEHIVAAVTAVTVFGRPELVGFAAAMFIVQAVLILSLLVIASWFMKTA